MLPLQTHAESIYSFHRRCSEKGALRPWCIILEPCKSPSHCVPRNLDVAHPPTALATAYRVLGPLVAGRQRSIEIPPRFRFQAMAAIATQSCVWELPLSRSGPIWTLRTFAVFQPASLPCPEPQIPPKASERAGFSGLAFSIPILAIPLDKF
jgi:hypothetical protein